MMHKTYKNVAAGMTAAVMLAASTLTVLAATPDAQSAAVAAQAEVTMNDMAIDEEMMIGMPSPIVEYDTLAEAEKAAGFRIQVPATITGYEEVSYCVISGELIQVDYRGANGDICIRKAAASVGEDISGDYNVYQDVQTVTVRGHEATIRGNGETAALATWTNQGYAYSVGIYDANGLAFTNHGMSAADMQNLVYVVR